MNRSDNYDLDRRSKTGKAGFEVFQNKKNGRYYFHCNDDSGKALLYSQGYQRRKSRDKGLESVKKNAILPKRILEKKTKEGSPFFIVRAGNNLEIARSRSFKDVAEMRSKRQWLTDFIRGKSSPAADRQKSEGRTTKTGRPDDATSTASAQLVTKPQGDTPPRYRFSLIYYPSSRAWVLKNTFSGESKHFQTLDATNFLAYLRDAVPQPKAIMPPRRQQSTSLSRPSSGSKPASVPGGIKRIAFQTEEGEPRNFIIEKQGIHGVILDLSPDAWQENDLDHYNASVYLQSIKNSRRTFLGDVRGEKPPQNGSIHVEIINNRLTPGIYRLYADVLFHRPGKSPQQLEGNQLVQLR